MTNTKFRKRALLSSVAMLLVALVALGSATFAWFTENPAVDANGITGQAQTSTGLEITTTTQGNAWGSTAKFMADGTADKFKFIPAYAYNTGDSTKALNFVTTKAGSSSSANPAAGAVWTAATPIFLPTDGEAIDDTKSGIYHEQVKIRTKNSSEGAVDVNLTGISIATKGSLAIKDGVTVLVAVNNEIKAVKKAGSSAIKYYPNATTSTENDANVVGNADSSDYPYTFSNAVGLGKADDGSTTAKTLVVDVYVYLDGTDDVVKTDNAIAGALIDTIKLDFAKA